MHQFTLFPTYIPRRIHQNDFICKEQRIAFHQAKDSRLAASTVKA
jgi:hypothetical protein